MRDKLLPISHHLEPMNNLLRHLKLKPNVAYERITPTLQEPCCVPEKPVKDRKGIGLPEWATPGPLDHFQEPGKAQLETSKLESLATNEGVIRPEQ
jgi:hypothetical protein